MSSRIDQAPRPEHGLRPSHERRHGVTAEDVLKLVEQVRQQAKVEGSQLLRVDVARLDANVRQVLADETIKILQGVPGFALPQLSKPPTTSEVKSLLKALQQLEQQGLLQEAGVFGPRGGAAEAPSLKAWSEFVQAPTTAQQGQNKGMAEGGQTPTQLFSSELVRQNEGPSLRQPQMAGDPFKAMSNKQKLDLMSAAFGEKLALALKSMGIRDPGALMKAASTPEGRANLAQALGMSRGALTAELSKAEMLTIGAGSHGEMALRPAHLPALRGAGIVTMPQVAGMRGLAPGQFEVLYQNIRSGFSGFAKALSGERPILKKDLQHWSKTAARRKSSILDQEWEETPRGNGDAEELIMGWYLEHWNELEDKRKRQATHDKDNKIVLAETDLLPSVLQFDAARDDGLICFWVERPNFDANRPALTERVYVCLDPKTGTIDPKSKE